MPPLSGTLRLSHARASYVGLLGLLDRLTSGRNSSDHGGDRERPDYVRRGVRGGDRLVRVRVVSEEVDPANTRSAAFRATCRSHVASCRCSRSAACSSFAFSLSVNRTPST
jgi:hypothetical protein